MKEQLKNIFSQTAIYSLGNISTKLVGFILLPLYTGYLTTSEYGILALLEVVSQILIAIFTFNLPIAMLRWISETKNQKEEKGIIFTTYISLIVIAAFTLFAGLLSTKALSLLIFQSDKYVQYLHVLLISASLTIINRHPLTLLRHREKAAFFAAVNILKLILILSLNIYFVAYAKTGILGVVISMALGEGFVTLATFPFLIKNLQIAIKLNVLKEMFAYGFPLVFAGLSSILLSFSDRFILQYFSGASQVGIYSLGYKISAVINMFLIQSFTLGYLPFTFKRFDKPDSGNLFARVMTYYTAALLYSAIFISFFAKELLLLLAENSDYYISYLVVPFIALAFVFRGMQYNFALSFHFTKKTKINAAIIVATAILNIALNLVLVPKYGFLGSGISMFISFLIMLIATIVPAQKEYSIPYEKSRLYKLLLIGLIAFSSFALIELLKLSEVTSLILKTAAVVLTIIIPFIFKVFYKSEIDFILNKLGIKQS